MFSSIPIFWVAILAGVVQIFGYLDYLRQSQRENAAPNIAAWGMWAFGAATHLWAYSQVTEGWEQDFLPAICSATCLLVFIFLFLGKKFERETPLSVWEKLVFWGDVGIAALFGANIFSASFAAVALQLDDTLTYLPTIKDTARKASCEHPRPWVFGTIGYALRVGRRSGWWWVD